MRLTADQFHFKVFHDLKTLPHFDTDLSNDHAPQAILDFRNCIAAADAVLICTP